MMYIIGGKKFRVCVTSVETTDGDYEYLMVHGYTRETLPINKDVLSNVGFDVDEAVITRWNKEGIRGKMLGDCLGVKHSWVSTRNCKQSKVQYVFDGDVVEYITSLLEGKPCHRDAPL